MPYQMKLWLTLCVTGLILLELLITNTAIAGDMWAYFPADSVKKYGCKVRDVELQLNGTGRGEMIWSAVAFAERDKDSWEFEVGRFPYTVRGRHKAGKACEKWQDKAEKRVHKAQP